jgi:hypothetical protein
MNSMQPRRPQEGQTFNTWASMGLIRIYSSVANVHCGNVFFAGTEPELVDEDFFFFSLLWPSKHSIGPTNLLFGRRGEGPLIKHYEKTIRV